MYQLLGTLSLLISLQSLPVLAENSISALSETPSDPLIERVVSAGLMSKNSEGQFQPERIMSRAELASILVKTFDLNKREIPNQPSLVQIPDVPSSHWAFNDIQTAIRTGVMRGYRDNMFFPNQRVTRAEALAIFSQAYGVFQFPDETVAKILADYPDSDQIPSWAKRSMATALYEGFVKTDGDGKINPLSPMTRRDMAYVLSKYLERQENPASVLGGEYFSPSK